ncbi:hypothetical protein FBU30_008320 [Linnemannia zychae]|nr:hypothetical protein FBU30_008320 [Linnemannia zychae]
MTRTRTGEYKDVVAPGSRRQSRSSLGDPRAIPKKAGAGNANWGVPGCELNQQEQTSVLNDSANMSSSPIEKKLTVIDAKTFAQLQNSAANPQAETANEHHITTK